jgi:hypothetical protein
VQFNACASEANANGGNKGTFSVNDCDRQKNACSSAQAIATATAFSAQQTQSSGTAQVQSSGNGGQINIGPDPAFPDFDLICDQ